MRIIQTRVGPNEVPLTGYLQDVTSDGGIRNIRPSIVILPGGGYRYRSPRERESVAMHFLAQSYNVFILDYSVEDQAAGLNPLLEISSALMKIREHAMSWMCDPTRVAVIGFSAGGHLAASIALLHDHKTVTSRQKIVDQNNRPDAVILSYPVINDHEGSLDLVSGGDEELRKLFLLDQQVTETAVPAFIWHTVTDNAVPVENALDLARGYRKAGVEFELHLFESGDHGLSMCTEEVGTPHPGARQWVDLATYWLNTRFNHVL
ncbi:MAG: alpha/beta hydrolase [Spirochaetales bacterium]|nr:alpha/beta hydrolase [Spirochaetales bacterium]